MTRQSCCVCGNTAVADRIEKGGLEAGKCFACGLWYMLEIRPDYETLYTEGDKYHADFGGHVPYRERYFHDLSVSYQRFKKLQQYSRPRLLDVGAANGAFVEYLAHNGWDAEGLEPNAGIAAWAAQKTGCRFHTTWETVVGPFALITYLDVIEHVPDPVHELARARSYLTGTGILVLDTPDADDPRFAELRAGWHHLRPHEHLWYFTESHLTKLLHRTGFWATYVDRPIPGKLVIYAQPRL